VSLIDLCLRVHEHLDAASVPHAFGGALALSYVADPRGTVDIDVNVFVPVDDIGIVLTALEPLGLEPEGDLDRWMPAAGLRLRSAQHPFPVDLFLSLAELYEEVRQRSALQPFGPKGELIPVLGAEDRARFKLSFGRPKDWVGQRSMVASVPLDVEYIERQALALRGPSMHPRLARLRQIVRGQAQP
jgi:hypothetical protein